MNPPIFRSIALAATVLLSSLGPALAANADPLLSWNDGV